jgi:hypothetical protein
MPLHRSFRAWLRKLTAGAIDRVSAWDLCRCAQR